MVKRICDFFTVLNSEKTIRCDLCPHYCVIKKDQIGYCGARRNIDGILYPLNYGQISAMALDPIEKKPIYHFCPHTKIFSIGSWGCNMHCKFCQNFSISQEYKNLKYQFVLPEQIIQKAKEIKDNVGIAFTYNEPSISFEYIYDCLKLIDSQIKIVYVSNGMINLKPLAKIIDKIDAFNIDLKAFTKEFYQEHGGNIEAIKETIKFIYEHKKHIELTLLVIPNKNDDLQDMEKMAK